MKERITKLLEDRISQIIIKIFLIFLLFFIVLALWKWTYLPPQLPLFYSRPRSPEQLGSPLQLILLPVISLIFFVVNMLFAAYTYSKERLASIILMMIGLICSLLVFVTFLRIIFLVS